MSPYNHFMVIIQFDAGGPALECPQGSLKVSSSYRLRKEDGIKPRVWQGLVVAWSLAPMVGI